MGARLNWTVDYGRGPVPVSLPHCWLGEMPMEWEGPAVYECAVETQSAGSSLLFHGVSYGAEVTINGSVAMVHEGIWDAFTVPVPVGKSLVRVAVVKNGGDTFPVRDVASGFLPFVFQTFGGVWREVELVEGAVDLEPAAPASRVQVKGRKLEVDGKPFYFRAPLHWGWYPELGHPNPPREVIRREISLAQEMGFNAFKFCLWVPPHSWFEELESAGMFAWLELPLWDPSPDPQRLANMADEMGRIVRHYRRHSNIIIWTVGCELSESTPPDFRRSLVEMIRAETGWPLIKDNSGGAEMYGGDPQEFGDFEDFHPYCDTHYYPQVLDSLGPGARHEVPTLLGEFNDYDTHRDLARHQRERTYYFSQDGSINPQGVRWTHDLPAAVHCDSRWQIEERTFRLREASLRQSAFIRDHVQRQVRARDWIGGYVITGWRDTPISSAGFLDDWGEPKMPLAQSANWNGDACLFLVPRRSPPWIHGGNRPGWEDPQCRFAGPALFQVGLHSVSGARGQLEWRVSQGGRTVFGGKEAVAEVEPLCARLVGRGYVSDLDPGDYELDVTFDKHQETFPIWVVPRYREDAWRQIQVHDPRGKFAGPKYAENAASLLTTELDDVFGAFERVLVVLGGEGTVAKPFWREAAYESDHAISQRLHGLLLVGSDRALDPAFCRERLAENFEVLINRVDMRTYAENPVLIRYSQAGTEVFVTSLRIQGGQGIQPVFARNPIGQWFVQEILGRG